MCESEIFESKWKLIISKHLGISVARKWRQLMLDVKAVDLGVKPGYLYDIGPPIGEKLQSFIVELVDETLISSQLNIVEVEMDCFIVKADSVQEIRECFEKTDFESLQTKFVDITNDSHSVITDNEAIRTDLKEAVNDIAANVVSDRVHHYVLTDTLCCNRTSLFGVLLGYPVVYWFDERKSVVQNVLSMVPLCCVTVNSEVASEEQNSKENKNKHTLYSFSYPACHDGALRDVINSWFSKLKIKCRHTSFEELSMNTMEKSFEAISL